MGYSVEYDGEFKTNVPIDAETMKQLLEQGLLEKYEYWQFQSDLQTLEWQGGQKFNTHETWIVQLVEALQSRGYTLSGKVHFQGEEIGDCGVIDVTPNCITLFMADLTAAHPKFDSKILWSTVNV